MKKSKIVLIVLLTLIMLFMLGTCYSACVYAVSAVPPATTTTSTLPQTQSDTNVGQEEVEVTTETEEATNQPTLGEINALKKAGDYLKHMNFSYSGLINQLEFEGYSTEEATYAADNCGADWNEQAAGKAKSYISNMSFSRSGLIEQLEFEGFTSEQAEYGVTAVGY